MIEAEQYLVVFCFFFVLLLNRCLPLNFRAEDLASGILRERVKVGASLADVDPMLLDKSVGFVKTLYFPSPNYA